MHTINYKDLKIGDLLLADCKNGYYALIQVIDSTAQNGQERVYGKNTFVFAALDWYSNKKPVLADFMPTTFLEKLFKKNKLPSILKKVSFSWKGRPETLYVPKEVFTPGVYSIEYLGNLPPVYFDPAWNRAIGAFDGMVELVIDEWLWKHDRTTLEEKIKNRKDALMETLAKEKSDEVKWLKTATLKDLLSKDLFSEWKRLWPEKVVLQSREICRETVERLEKAGNNMGLQNAALTRFIEQFNQLSSDNNDFIETEEREDIYVFYNRMVTIAKIDNAEELFGRLREF